jgi:recombination protein RecA
MSDFLKNLSKHGLDVRSASDAAKINGWVDTGNYALNWAVGGRFNRGYPLGHTVELYGEPSTGKSYLVLRAIAEVQKGGGHALLDDTEGALNADWASKALGVDVDQLAYYTSGLVKEHFETVDAFLKTVEPDEETPYVLALDSLGELTTTHEVESDFDTPDMTKAKKLHSLFRRVGKDLSGRPAVYLVTNHVYEGPGAFQAKKSSGGRALEFKASVRLSLRRTKQIKSGGEITGVYIRVRVQKNRIVAPFREVEMIIPFNRGISKFSGLIPVLLQLGVVEEDGRRLAYKGENTGVYTQKTNPLKQEESAKELVKKYPDILEHADEILADREVGNTITDERIVEENDESAE